MIWDIIEQTGFNRYFSDPSTTITTLLLDENIITELKNQNPQLLQYLQQRKHDFMTQLIIYTTTMPEEHQGHDRCHRLPYISSELLAIDSDLIYGEFFREGQKEEQNEYWKLLLKFLDTTTAHNEILMGYFQKVVNNLYAGNKMKTAVVVNANLDRFIRLLPNGSITDILKQCIVMLNVPEGVVLSERTEIQNRVVSMLIESPSEQIRKACGQILGEVVNKFQAFSSGDTLISELLASSPLLKIYEIETSEAVNDFLQYLLKKIQQRTVNENDQSVPILSLPQHHKVSLQKYLTREGQNIRNISKSPGFIINQNQQTVRKSNKAMYSILSLLGIALQQGIGEFVNQGFLNFCWNLTILYPYNNILQVLIKKIFFGVLSTPFLRSTFLMNYQSQLVTLCKHNLVLLRPFVYQIWAVAKKYDKITTDPVILSDFAYLVQTTLQPMVKYEVKEVQKHHTQMKLVVDEEDQAAPGVNQQINIEKKTVVEKEDSEKEEEKKSVSQVSSDFEQFSIDDMKEEKEQGAVGFEKDEEEKMSESDRQVQWKEVKEKKGNFNLFDSFTVESKPSQTVPKKDLFDNFSDFL